MPTQGKSMKKTLITKTIPRFFLVATLYSAAQVQAYENKLFGDLYDFYGSSCAEKDITGSIFKGGTTDDLQVIDAITNEIVFNDVYEYLSGSERSETLMAIQSNTTHGVESSKELLREKDLMTQSAHWNRLLDYVQSVRAREIRIAHEFLHEMTQKDPNYGIALLTVVTCKIVRNSRNLSTPIREQLTAAHNHHYSPPPAPASKDSDGAHCSCATRSVCYGPRGGRFCITSGGNKRYGI